MATFDHSSKKSDSTAKPSRLTGSRFALQKAPAPEPTPQPAFNPEAPINRALDENGNPGWWSRLTFDPPRYGVQPKLNADELHDQQEQEADRLNQPAQSETPPPWATQSTLPMPHLQRQERTITPIPEQAMAQMRSWSVARSPVPPEPEPNVQAQSAPVPYSRPAWWDRLTFNPQRPSMVRPKLTVGAPNDQYEQEADHVADQVMSMPDAATQQPIQREATLDEGEVQPKPLAAAIAPLVQREMIPEEDEKLQPKALAQPLDQRIAAIQREAMLGEDEVQPKLVDAIAQREAIPDEDDQALQRQAIATSDIQREAMPDGSLQAGSDLENQLSSSQGGGSPLSDDVRSFMEPRFGADFSQVRVHTGSESVQMNRDLNAQAFTHKQDVYFGAGKAPGNNSLTAHELTHVVQQTGGVQTKLTQNQPDIQQKCSACETEDTTVRRKENSNAQVIQRKIGDGHDLTSPRFAGDPVLEACFDGKHRMLLGETGEAVEKVQQALTDSGLPLKVDGIFGAKTQAAVAKFKLDNGITPSSGVVGPQTMAELDRRFQNTPQDPPIVQDQPPELEIPPIPEGNLPGEANSCEALVSANPSLSASPSAFTPTASSVRLENKILGCDIGELLKKLLDGTFFIELSAVGRARLLQEHVDRGELEKAFERLNLLPMQDLLDTLRVERLNANTDTDQSKKPLKATFLSQLNEHMDDFKVSDQVKLAIQVATDRKIPEDNKDIFGNLPDIEKEKISSFIDVRDWATKLRTNIPKERKRNIIDYIERARANIPDRSAGFRDTGVGLSYRGSSRKDKNPDPAQLEQGSQQKQDFNRQVWDEMENEGHNSATVTHKDTKLIWGRGFTAGKEGKGQLTPIVQQFLKGTRDASLEFLDAGIKVEDNTWLVVDTKTGLVEKDSKALSIIQNDNRLLSLLVEVAEDNGYAQNFADAQFNQLKKVTANVTEEQLKILNEDRWKQNSRFVKFAAHSVHRNPGSTSWRDFTNMSNVSTKELVRLFGQKVGKKTPKPDKEGPINSMGATFVGFEATQDMMGFAPVVKTVIENGKKKIVHEGLALEALGESDRLRPEMRSFLDSKNSDKLKNSVFFKDPKPKVSGEAYFEVD